MPSLRPNRKTSRTSSPFVRTANPSPAPGPEPKKERTQTSLDAWVEPHPRTPVPSFEDHGFERGGVVSYMAPLGALPPTKLKIKVKGDPRQEKSESLPSIEVASQTPEGTPPVEVEPRPQTPKPVEPELQPAIAPLRNRQEEEDGDYMPNGVTAAPRGAKSPTLKNGTPTSAPSRRASTSRGTPYSANRSSHMRTPSRSEIFGQTVVNSAVNSAVELSQRQGQPRLGLVVKRFYQESHNNPALAELLDALFQQNATDEQRAQFEQEIRRLKKKIKAEEASAKRLQKSLQLSEGKAPFNSYSSSTTMASYSAYSAAPTIGSFGTTTPSLPHPSQPSFLTLQPAFRSSHNSPTKPSVRSTTPPFPPSPIINGAGAEINGMVSTRASGRKTTTAQPPVTETTQPSASVTASASIDTQPPAGTGTTNVIPKPATTNGKPRKASKTPMDQSPAAEETPAPSPRRTRNSRSLAQASTNEAQSDAQPQQSIQQPNQQPIQQTPAAAGAASSTPAIASASAGTDEQQTESRERSLSDSSLSSVQSAVLKKGPPSAPNSPPRPSRANSRPAAVTKSKHKKNASRTGLGSKPAINEAGPSDTSAQAEKNKQAKAVEQRLKDQLEARKAEFAPPTESDFRNSAEYTTSLFAPRPSTPPSSDGPTPSDFSNSPAPRSSAPASTTTAGLSTSRRTRESTQRQTIDLSQTNFPNLLSRAPSTPRGEPAAKRRKTARTKTSPVKPVARGIAATTTSAQDTPRSGTPAGDQENSDICYSCRQPGDLFCCDGCPNSFHYGCWDPPCEGPGDPQLAENPWLCLHCREAQAYPDDLVPSNGWTGILAAGGIDLNYRNPEMFKLPAVIKDSYRGYTEDKDDSGNLNGNYKSDIDPPYIVNQRNPTVAETVDEGKYIKDPKDIPFCVVCSLTIYSKPEIIRCDVCKQHWHTDCLDPPHTHVPEITESTQRRGNREQQVFKKRYFRCPRHTDQDMLLFSHVTYDFDGTSTHRGIKIREPVKPKIVKPALTRGFKNNGRIEVGFSDDEDEVEPEPEVPETDDTVYKLSEKSIILDFIQRAKEKRIEKQQDVEGLLRLLHPEKQQELADRVNKSWQASIDAEVQRRMDEFYKTQAAAAAMATLSAGEQDAVNALVGIRSHN